MKPVFYLLALAFFGGSSVRAADPEFTCIVNYAAPDEVISATKEKRSVHYKDAGQKFHTAAKIVDGKAEIVFEEKNTAFQYTAKLEDGQIRTVLNPRWNGVYFVNRTDGKRTASVFSVGTDGLPFGLVLGDKQKELEAKVGETVPWVALVQLECEIR